MRKKKSTSQEIAKALGISHARAMESVMKAQLTGAIKKYAEEDGWTHAQIAAKSGVPRSAVTGILSFSMQRVTIDRLLRIADALGLSAKLIIKRAS